MLVLTRRMGERIVIGPIDGKMITIVIVDLARGKVRLGFDAPSDIQIMREELIANQGDSDKQNQTNIT